MIKINNFLKLNSDFISFWVRTLNFSIFLGKYCIYLYQEFLFTFPYWAKFIVLFSK